jgi:acyl-CoA thioester hydrolase
LNEQERAPEKHRTRLRVRYAETDQMGVVYHANYLVWMEVGRVELVRARGHNYKDLEAGGFFLSVVEASCRYLSPARYDQDIEVITEMAESNPRFVRFRYEIRSLDPDQLLATGSTRHVWLNRQWRPTRLPEQYRELMRVG